MILALILGHPDMPGAELAASIQDAANRKNLLLLVLLRWLAVGGQVATIAVVVGLLGIALPIVPMGWVLLFLVGLNIVSLERCRIGAVITDAELLAELLADVAALTVQLYLSGGAMNPFISLFLLQAVLGAVLLPPRLSWLLVGVAAACFVGLTHYFQPLDLSAYPRGPVGLNGLFDLQVAGMFVCFLLVAILLVAFISRINGNLREGDRRLAELRQQSSEEEHIIHMGLLASGAAHELGTPLATLSVILNDWETMPELHNNAATREEIAEMQAALAHCKNIVSEVLLTAGEARGEDAERTTLQGFLDEVVAEWRTTRMPAHLDYAADIVADTAIVSDAVLRQSLLNVFDNALEASPDWVSVEAARQGDTLVVTVRDRGPGFAPQILENFGKPYQSTKQHGNGLGLFLVVTVLRKLGGNIGVRNLEEGGAEVALHLPVVALALEEEVRHAV